MFQKAMPAGKQGFSPVLVIVIISLIVTVGMLLWQTPNVEEKILQTVPRLRPQKSLDSKEPPLKLKNIGVNLDYYDPKTNKAGDLVFTKQNLQFNRLFMEFGFVIPAEISSGGKAKSNPQPTFILPLGTPVRSLVDGVVAQMPTLWSGDISIQVTADGKLQRWVYETEHVINPKVKVGDKVRAGEIIAEVSNFDKGTPVGFGAVEIGILHGGGEGIPEHVCPFLYLDESIKEDTLQKMKSLFTAWENYIGDQTLYSETSIPSCLTLDSIPG